MQEYTCMQRMDVYIPYIYIYVCVYTVTEKYGSLEKVMEGYIHVYY